MGNHPFRLKVISQFTLKIVESARAPPSFSRSALALTQGGYIRAALTRSVRSRAHRFLERKRKKRILCTGQRVIGPLQLVFHSVNTAILKRNGRSGIRQIKRSLHLKWLCLSFLVRPSLPLHDGQLAAKGLFLKHDNTIERNERVRADI